MDYISGGDKNSDFGMYREDCSVVDFEEPELAGSKVVRGEYVRVKFQVDEVGILVAPVSLVANGF